MNRVYLVASANMEAKVKEVMDAVAGAGLIAAAYKPCVNGAEAAKELKAHNSALLMEKIAADFLSQDFDSVDAVVVEGAQGMSDVIAQKYNDSLATALDAKIYSDSEDADLFCPNRLLACSKCLAKDLAAEPAERKTSQAMFRAGLLLKASKAKKRIVLPEGSEPRTVQAAKLVIDRKIAVPAKSSPSRRNRESPSRLISKSLNPLPNLPKSTCRPSLNSASPRASPKNRPAQPSPTT